MSTQQTISSSSASSTSRVDRKSLKKPDELVSLLASFFNSLAAHAKLVAGIALALLLATAAFWGWSNVRSEKEELASAALYEAGKSFEKEMKALIPPAPAENAKSIKNKTKDAPKDAIDPSLRAAFAPLSVDEKFTETKAALLQVSEKHAGTRASAQAMHLLGKLYLDHGQAELSIPHFQKAIELAQSNTDKATYTASLAYGFEDSGKKNEAAEAFERASRYGVPTFRGDLLLGQARNLSATGAKDRAKAIYNQVLKELPDTTYAQTAKQSLQQLP